jgi:photosystem II stability/assembly factor-like uncharacterized protein
MDLPNGSDGWLATGDGTPPTQLWRTGDGGKTWLAALSLQGTGFFDRVHFLDGQRGYLLLQTPAFDVSSNIVMVTTDGGLGWQSLAFPKPQGMVLADLYEGADGKGRALFSAGASGNFGHQDALLYTTPDGSAWSLAVQVDYNHLSSHGISAEGTKGPMAFVDAEHGAIFSQLDAGRLGVYSTADGGSNWSLHLLDSPAGDPRSIGPAAASLAVVDSQLLLGVAFREGAAPAATAVYRSTDGGASWSAPIELPATDGVSAPVFASPEVWWVPDTTAVLVTDDGGGNWIRTELGLTGTTRVKAVYPIDDRRAWAFAGGSFGPPTLLYETTDRGATWSVRKPPG